MENQIVIDEIKGILQKEENFQEFIDLKKENFKEEVSQLKILFKNIFNFLEKEKIRLDKKNIDIDISYKDLDNILYKNLWDNNTNINDFFYSYCWFEEEKDKNKLLNLLYYILYFPFLEEYKYWNIIYFIFREEILLTYYYVYLYTWNIVVGNLYEKMKNSNDKIYLYKELSNFSLLEDFKIKGTNKIKKIDTFWFWTWEDIDLWLWTNFDIKEIRGNYNNFLNFILDKSIIIIDIEDYQSNEIFLKEIINYIDNENNIIKMNNTFWQFFGKWQEDIIEEDIISKIYEKFKNNTISKIILKELYLKGNTDITKEVIINNIL